MVSARPRGPRALCCRAWRESCEACRLLVGPHTYTHTHTHTHTRIHTHTERTPLYPFTSSSTPSPSPAGGGFRAPSSALPLGATAQADPLKVCPAAAGPELTHSLCAVSHAAAPDQLLASNIAGFVLISNIDSARGVVSYLAPCGGPLPGRYLLAGSVKAFVD